MIEASIVALTMLSIQLRSYSSTISGSSGIVTSKEASASQPSASVPTTVYIVEGLVGSIIRKDSFVIVFRGSGGTADH